MITEGEKSKLDITSDQVLNLFYPGALLKSMTVKFDKQYRTTYMYFKGQLQYLGGEL